MSTNSNERTHNCSGIMDLSIRNLLTEWGREVRDFFQDITSTTGATDGRFSLLVASFSKDRRLFYIGLTLVLLAILLLFWDMPSYSSWGSGHTMSPYPGLFRVS